MTQVYSFTVPGKAVPWMRTNAVRGRKVTPKQQRHFQKKVRDLASLAGVPLIHGPVRLDVTTFLTGRVAPYKATSGDWDNYAKTIGDALQGVAFANDCQIVDGRGRKLSPDELGPRVEVEVEALATAPHSPPKRASTSRLTPAYHAGRP